MKIDRSRIALGAFQYLRYSMDYFLDTAVMLNISQVELYAAAPQLCLQTVTDGELAVLERKLRDRRLNVCCLTPEQVNYPMNLTAEDEGLRRYSIATTRRAIQAAGMLGSPLVLVTMGHSLLDRPRESAWERGIDSLRRLAEYAKSQGVKLVLETLTPLSSDLLNTPEQQRQAAALMPEGTMALMVDLGQMVYMDQTLDRYLAHGPLLQHVHLHDSHPGIHMALGEGDLPIREYLEQIESSGYRGCYSLEQNDPRYRSDPRAADIRSVRWLETQQII